MAPTSITLVGNLVRTPELRYVSNGQPTCTLSVAANRRVQPRTSPQQWTMAVSYYDIVVWGDLAENVASSAQKGMRIVVTGRLDQRAWVDAEGKKHSRYEIVADDVGASMRFATAAVTRVFRATSLENDDNGDGRPPGVSEDGEIVEGSLVGDPSNPDGRGADMLAPPSGDDASTDASTDASADASADAAADEGSRDEPPAAQSGARSRRGRELVGAGLGSAEPF